jgi:mannose-6-phosphate isomerase-like protein (cupin superfamily)
MVSASLAVPCHPRNATAGRTGAIGGQMDAFELGELSEQQAAGESRYREFLRVPALSSGLYVLPVGADDTQQPHDEDEVYHVLSGRASILVADEVRPVQTGSIVYVAAHVEHRFIDITEELRVLVFFAASPQRS